MMNDKRKSPLKIALHGMDGRSYKMMVMYLQGPCRGAAVVVEDLNAEVDLFDADSVNTKAVLEQRLKDSERPIIALSLQEQTLDKVIPVRKPVKTDDFLAALKKAEAILSAKKKPAVRVSPSTQNTDTPSAQDAVTKTESPLPSEKKRVIKTDEQKKTSKHQTAMLLDEGKFNAYIGSVAGLDVNDPKQFSKAAYNPKEYYQGYVQSALQVAETKKQILHLNTGWRPLVIFPQNHEVWLDADDKQLRAFASVDFNRISGAGVTLTPAETSSTSIQEGLEKFHSTEAFLWKLAVWTSKGRYPDAVDINRPVFLKQWPNFTRLVVTPHALRIAALLIEGPRTLPDIAEALKIKPQYVFVFISAAYALGVVGQAKRESDEIIQPTIVKKTGQQGLLGRIIGKLRGNIS